MTGGLDKHSVGNDGADKLANQAIGVHVNVRIKRKRSSTLTFRMRKKTRLKNFHRRTNRNVSFDSTRNDNISPVPEKHPSHASKVGQDTFSGPSDRNGILSNTYQLVRVG